MSVRRLWRKQFIFLKQENFLLDCNVVILIPLCENTSVPSMKRVCRAVQQPGRQQDWPMPLELGSVSLRPDFSS